MEVKEKYTFKNLKVFLSNSLWAVKELYTLAPFEYVSEILITILTAALPTLTAFFYAKFIDQLTLILTGKATLDFFNPRDPLTIIIIITALIYFTQSILANFEDYLTFRFKEYHLNRYTNLVYKKIANLDIQQYEDPSTSGSIQKAKDNLWRVRDFSLTLTQTLTMFTTLVVAASILIKGYPLLLLILFICAIPASISYGKYVVNWWKYYEENIHNFRKNYAILSVITDEKYIFENKITNIAGKLFDKVSEITNFLFSQVNEFRTKFLKESLIRNFIDLGINIMIPVYFILDILKNHFTLGYYTFYSGRAQEFYSEISRLYRNLVDLFDSGLGIKSLRNVMDLKPVLVNGKKKLKILNSPTIEFRHVWFKYPKSKKWILKDINMTIKTAEEIAIVGENGAGKTTLVKLILRFYDPTVGKIFVNDVPLQELDLNSYYNLVGVLFQDYNTYRFLTVEENIHIGNRKGFKPLSILKAIKFADAEKFIHNLEYGFKQIVSKSYEKGTNLSTGQQQKLALARMFYRDAPILILDEPTASIDAVSEYKIFNRIYKFMNNKTVIIISHRFSTVRNAKKIYVIDQGRILESGSHNELMAKNGKYALAFNLQAKGYQSKEENSED